MSLIDMHLFFAQIGLFEHHFVCHIVFVDIADVAHSLLTDLPRDHELDICKHGLLRRTFLRVPASKKPDERRSFSVSEYVTVSLSSGRFFDGIVKAVINRLDGVRLQVDFGGDETALVYLGQVRPMDS